MNNWLDTESIRTVGGTVPTGRSADAVPRPPCRVPALLYGPGQLDRDLDQPNTHLGYYQWKAAHAARRPGRSGKEERTMKTQTCARACAIFVLNKEIVNERHREINKP